MNRRYAIVIFLIGIVCGCDYGRDRGYEEALYEYGTQYEIDMYEAEMLERDKMLDHMADMQIGW